MNWAIFRRLSWGMPPTEEYLWDGRAWIGVEWNHAAPALYTEDDAKALAAKLKAEHPEEANVMVEIIASPWRPVTAS